MGRGVSPSEERSWRTTLRKISLLFEHINNKDEQYILLEFKVPLTQKRIDVILVGSDGVKNSLLIIELKGWGKSYISTVENALKIDASYGHAVSHPAREAQEYKEIMSEQFSDISKGFENLEAIALLPNYKLINNDPILSEQFHEILKEIEMYHSDNINDFKKMLSAMFKFKILKRDVEFLNKLEYKPTLDFQKHLETQFKDIKLSTSQELAFNAIKTEIDNHINNPTAKKLFTISGLPGAGKTVIAFKLLGYIYSAKKMTAKLQLPGPEFRDSVKKAFSKNDFNNMIGGAYSKGEHQVIIIDEAHKAYGQGTSKQFYSELFRNSNFVIALIDDNQVVNKKGFTKNQVIEKAQEEKFDIVELELKEQFRNAGDSLYIDWLKNTIYNDDEENMQNEFVQRTYKFGVLSDKEFNDKYRSMYETHNVRIGSFWTQKWNAEMDENNIPVPMIKVGSSKYVWNINTYWIKSFYEHYPDLKSNKEIKSKFTSIIKNNFNRSKKGVEYMAYFNTIQGSEFEYFFVHIPKLFFLNDKNELDVDLTELDMIDMKYQVWTSHGEPNKKKEELNKLYFKNRLLVNLTRGTKGTYIYCEDKKLEKWFKNRVRK